MSAAMTSPTPDTQDAVERVKVALNNGPDPVVSIGRAELRLILTRLSALEERERVLVDLLCLADEAFMSRHRSFPLDRTNTEQKFWNDALCAVRQVTGDDFNGRKERARRALSTPNPSETRHDD